MNLHGIPCFSVAFSGKDEIDIQLRHLRFSGIDGITRKNLHTRMDAIKVNRDRIPFSLIGGRRQSHELAINHMDLKKHLAAQGLG